MGGVVHRFTFSADIGADAHVAKWIVRLETRAKLGLDRAIALYWWNGDQLPPEAESEAVPWSLVPCGDGAGWVTAEILPVVKVILPVTDARRRVMCEGCSKITPTYGLASDGHSIHCPEIGAAGSQIDRGRRMTVNATLRSCAR